MNFKLLAGGIALTLILAGCSSGNSNSSNSGNSGTPVSKIEHMHGLSYSADGTIYLATHEGLLAGKDGQGWSLVGKEASDFMGFNALPDGTMISSGHPGKGSKLPNPMGFIVSKDNGQSWKSVAYVGNIDFHILVPNVKQPNVIYGLNQMGEGKFGAGIYKTTDGGQKWEQIKPNGLPNDLHKVLTILSLPENPDVLLAGVDGVGVMVSNDGGKNWKMFDSQRLVTALQSVPNSNDIIGYVISQNESGMMTSKDGGKTWEKLGLDLGKDAVAYIGVNPKNPKEIVVGSFDNSVYVSTDGGKTWKALVENGSPKK